MTTRQVFWPIYPVSGGSGEDEPADDSGQPADGSGVAEPPAGDDAPSGPGGDGELPPVDSGDVPGESDPPAEDEPAYVVALREDIAWLRENFGASDERVKALESRLETMSQEPRGRRARSRPETVRTTVTVQEEPPTERPEPVKRKRKTWRGFGKRPNAAT